MLKLRIWRSDPGEGLGLDVQKQSEEVRLWKLRVWSEGAWACQRGKPPFKKKRLTKRQAGPPLF